ncbi:MAG TPA: DUF1570 domain-containing protein [Gemmataceae bacterium]|nr:DUF1570 domain-containing protein [Gemmataceae bacterium]
MKRSLFLAALFFASAGTASADYVLLKINLNQLSFMPSMPIGNAGAVGAAGAMGAPGAMGAMGGAAMGQRGGFPQPQPGIPGGFMGQPAPGMQRGGVAGFMGGPGPMGASGAYGAAGAAGAYGAVGGVGAAGAVGGAGAQGGVPDPNANPFDKFYPEDPNPKWITALVEVSKVSKQIQPTPMGGIVTCDTQWGKNIWIPVFSPYFPMVGAPRVVADTFSNEFSSKFTKEKKEKNIETMLNLARWTLSRGQVKKFHEVMDEAVKINEKHAIVKRYLQVKKGLASPFKDTDPMQRDLLKELASNGYRENHSKKGHYTIYAPQFGEDPRAEASVRRRLNLLEGTLETFYYWFAVEKNVTLQPELPKYRLIAVVTGSKEDFNSRHVQWGSLPKVADGFTPQRDNVIVMSSKPCVDDPNYAELDTLITTKLAEANNKLNQMGFSRTITRESLLNGEINTHKQSGGAAIYISAAQTAVLLCASLEDQSDRHTISNEGVRQLLVASGMFPRNVQVPDWIVEGLAAFFENPVGGAFPTIGERNCVHLISFKHLRATHRDFKNADVVLTSVISDRYFELPRKLETQYRNARNDDNRKKIKNAWEVARSSSWAYVYYLSQKRQLDYLFKYGKELDKLPRDMDLSPSVLEGCFARAFNMADARNPQLLDDTKVKNMAANWLEMMEGKNLDNSNLQTFFEKERARQDAEKSLASTPNPGIPGLTPLPGPGPNPNPGIVPPMPNPGIYPMPPMPVPNPAPNPMAPPVRPLPPMPQPQPPPPMPMPN